MVFFPNEKLELFEYTETSELNSYLEPKHEYIYTETVPCNFQPMSPSDSLKEFGEILEDAYKCIIDSNVDINPKMIVRLQGKTDTYEITGTPMVNTHFIQTKHTKIILRKQRKPTTVIKEETTEEEDFP